MKVFHIYVLLLIAIAVFIIFLMFRNLYIEAVQYDIECETQPYIVRNVKIAGSGINIVLATWEKHFTSRVLRDGCDRCTLDEIPIEDMTYREDVCVRVPKKE